MYMCINYDRVCRVQCNMSLHNLFEPLKDDSIDHIGVR